MQSTLLPESRNSSQQSMIMFMMMITAIFVMMSFFNKPAQKDPIAEKNVQQEDNQNGDGKDNKDQNTPKITDGSQPENGDQTAEGAAPEVQQKLVKPTFATLGSLDPKSPYRMLITLTNRGAAVTRVELNQRAYRDVQDKTGYLGQIVADLTEEALFFGKPKNTASPLDVSKLPENTAETLENVAQDNEVLENALEQEPDSTQPNPVDSGFSEVFGAMTEGCPVQVVGPGTPAEEAGLKPRDIIVAAGVVGRGAQSPLTEITSFAAFRNFLLATGAGESIELRVLRPKNVIADENNDEKTGNEKAEPDLDFETLTLTAKLREAPINIVRPFGEVLTYEQYNSYRGLYGYDPDKHDQLSYLCTLSTIDDLSLKLPKCVTDHNEKHKGVIPRDESLNLELEGVNMRNGFWELVSSTQDEAVFRIVLPMWQLEVTKTYRLTNREESDDPRAKNPNGGYHLSVSISVKNLGTKERTVAYQLDGPTGTPTEGAWYHRKTGPGWGAYGLQDIVVKFHKGSSETIANTTIANDNFKGQPWKDDTLQYLGVDTQYFQCTLLPKDETADDIWHSRSIPIRVGVHNTAWSCLTDISFRTYSADKKLKPASEGEAKSSFSREYSIFAGPKNPNILTVYGLQNTISYGWFWFVAIPMLWVLHFFKTYLVFHYGLAIILLTVCVRLLMYPMSKKQAINAAKNAMLMPEMQKIKEKYKGNLEAQSKAQQELWKKHNFNPLSGCLGIFIQLPIFIGLYKSLSIDVELYGAPLITERFRWCNDLAAPDMLYNWTWLWNSFGWTSFNTGQGMLALGPYFNILPMLTIAL
ncbi:MAG: YidC/Oxa1 family insertase periplasmic-domain containing protein, partial [Thermoguttaceae bacterium]